MDGTSEPVELKKGYKECFCKSNGCDGRVVTARTVQRHSQQDYEKLKALRKDSLDSVPEYGRRTYFDESIYNTNEAASTPLYPGSKLSVLAAVFIKIRTFVSHPYSTKEELSELFRCDKYLNLPAGNKMPGSYQEAHDILKPFLIPLEKYDVCVNDCVVYRKDYIDLEHCPKCGQERFENNRPRRNFTYFPLGPRIARILGSSSLVSLLTQESEVKDEIKDIQDTTTWNHQWFSDNGLFKGHLGIALSFCTDGMNPLKSQNKQYSMWPLMVQVLNYPPSFRKSNAGIQLLGIIPGNGTKEAFNLEPYFDIIVEELSQLCHCSIYIQREKKDVQVKLLQYILDFPAIAKVMHVQAQGGLRACPWCMNKGVYCKHCSKTKYLGSRQFLLEESPLRTSTEFPGGDIELDKTSQPYSKEQQEDLRQEYDNISVKTRKSNFAKANGVKGNYSFMKLPYHGFSNDYQPDGMHTVRRVASCIIQYLSQQFQTVKFEQVAMAERLLRNNINDVLYTLSASDKNTGNARVKSVQFTRECTGYKGNVFHNAGTVLKNHHGWQEYTVENIWVYALRGSMPLRQQRTFNYFFGVLSNLFLKKFHVDEISVLEVHLHQSIALMERDFPSHLFNITTHITHHFVENMKKFGPLYSSWMYPLERMNSWITRRCNNKSRMERCVMETYQLHEWVVYCSLTDKFPEAADPKNLICQKTMLDDGEIRFIPQQESMRKKRRNASIIKLTTVEVNLVNELLTLKDPLEQVTSLKKIETTSEFGEKYQISPGCFCKYLTEPELFCRVKRIFKVFANNKDQFLFEIEIFQLLCDEDSGLFYGYIDQFQNLRVTFLESLGRPSVYAIEESKLWLLSEKPNLNFTWMDQHITS